MKNLSHSISSICLLFILSCSGTNSGSGVSLQERFNTGMENLEREKYLQAQTDFKYVVMRGTGTDLGDDAQYYLGESYFKNKEYLFSCRTRSTALEASVPEYSATPAEARKEFKRASAEA